MLYVYIYISLFNKNIILAFDLQAQNVALNFVQAHDSPVRTMVWSHNESWMVTGDHAGYVKYWQSNMNNVKMFQAHKEAIRGLRYSIHHTSPYVSCGTLIDNTPILAVVKTLNAAFTLFCFCVFSIRIASVSVFVWVQR